MKQHKKKQENKTKTKSWLSETTNVSLELIGCLWTRQPQTRGVRMPWLSIIARVKPDKKRTIKNRQPTKREESEDFITMEKNLPMPFVPHCAS
jgi:hypothetical protein